MIFMGEGISLTLKILLPILIMVPYELTEMLFCLTIPTQYLDAENGLGIILDLVLTCGLSLSHMGQIL
jgi:hypothetical protein